MVRESSWEQIREVNGSSPGRFFRRASQAEGMVEEDPQGSGEKAKNSHACREKGGAKHQALEEVKVMRRGPGGCPPTVNSTARGSDLYSFQKPQL
jgi:hypothetical protein